MHYRSLQIHYFIYFPLKKILETERIVLREFATDDAEFIIKLVNTPSWIAFIGDRNIKTIEGKREISSSDSMKILMKAANRLFF